MTAFYNEEPANYSVIAFVDSKPTASSHYTTAREAIDAAHSALAWHSQQSNPKSRRVAIVMTWLSLEDDRIHSKTIADVRASSALPSDRTAAA